ncbi:MAG: glutathione transferase GstA [Burkholderiales bacterium]|nr:glutathione transferase GstA [Burkholderiales bacterium]
MKLYFSPAACSMAPHIVANELGIPLTLEKTDTRTKKTASGEDFHAINPKGYVPALQLDNGELLTEGPVISQYLADSKPGNTVMPAAGTLARYRVQEMLGYINSELHKTFGALFNPAIGDDAKAERIAYAKKRYALVEQQLAKGPYLFGEDFTAADAYLFTVTGWAKFLSIDMSEFPNLMAFQRRVASRPAVQATMKAEGLIA